jgi:dUTP pyrophosphatase
MAAARSKLFLFPSPYTAKLYDGIKGVQRVDVGLDLRFPKTISIPPVKISAQPTIVELDVRARLFNGSEYIGYYLVPRSSIAKTPLIFANSIGIIDPGYTGILKVPLHNLSDNNYTVEEGTSLFQIVAPNGLPFDVDLINNGEDFPTADTLRGENGFGSTGPSGQK